MGADAGLTIPWARRHSDRGHDSGVALLAVIDSGPVCPLQSTTVSPHPIPHTVFREPCLDFVNSAFADHRGSGTVFDRLDLAEWRRWFLERWNFRCPSQISAVTLTRLKKLRTQLRALLEERSIPSGAQIDRLNQLLSANPYRWQLRLDGGRRSTKALTMTLRATNSDWDAVMAGIVVSFADLITSGRVSRVKACGNPNCSFIFFDDSANRSRRWCEGGICGNLERVRAFRSRIHHGGAVGSAKLGAD
jgi:predicted RNA-binding Zn ribbon-like protein